MVAIVKGPSVAMAARNENFPHDRFAPVRHNVEISRKTQETSHKMRSGLPVTCLQQMKTLRLLQRNRQRIFAVARSTIV